MASTYPNHRQRSRARGSYEGCASAGSDIFFASFRNESRRLYRQHEQEEPENDDVDQSGIEKLRGIAFDQTDDKSGENCAFDIAKTTDDNDRESLDDNGRARKRGQD